MKMYGWFCKYQQVNFFSNVVKCVRPTYGNKEARASLMFFFFPKIASPGFMVNHRAILFDIGLHWYSG